MLARQPTTTIHLASIRRRLAVPTDLGDSLNKGWLVQALLSWGVGAKGTVNTFGHLTVVHFEDPAQRQGVDGHFDSFNPKEQDVKKRRHALVTLAVFGLVAFVSLDASAVVCAEGVVRAGCAGPNGAVAVKKPAPVRKPPVTCAAGVYRAGCVGPNGAVVTRKPAPPPVTCAAGVYHAGCVGPNGAAVGRR